MAMALGGINDPDPEVPERARRRQHSARYKLETLAEYDSLNRDAKGALLRREGLYTSLSWASPEPAVPFACKSRALACGVARESGPPPRPSFPRHYPP